MDRSSSYTVLHAFITQVSSFSSSSSYCSYPVYYPEDAMTDVVDNGNSLKKGSARKTTNGYAGRLRPNAVTFRLDTAFRHESVIPHTVLSTVLFLQYPFRRLHVIIAASLSTNPSRDDIRIRLQLLWATDDSVDSVRCWLTSFESSSKQHKKNRVLTLYSWPESHKRWSASTMVPVPGYNRSVRFIDE